MSFIHSKFVSLFSCGLLPCPSGHQPAYTLVHYFTHGGSLAQQAVHHGLMMNTAAMTAAAASTAAAAGSAAMCAAAAGSAAAMSAAVAQAGRVWSVRAAINTILLATSAWVTMIASAAELASLLISSLPRTIRTATWGVRAGLSYKQFSVQWLGEDPETPGYQAALGALHTHWAAKLLAVCRANGGVYVKAGQFASAFGAVPREYRLALAGLEDRAVPRPYKLIQQVLERELGPNALAMFAEFDQHATAAASLAQVHHARLVDGSEVAVKVQYPGLAASVAADLAVLSIFNALASRLFPSYRLAWLIDELSKKLDVEMDFRTEIHNAQRLGKILKDHPRAAVPTMYTEMCSPRLLVMEWIAGMKITDREALKKKNIGPRAVGLQLVKLFAELTFVHGFMHGDPHAGNLMVREKGGKSWWSWLLRGSRQGFEVVLLDHGTYLELDPLLREQFCQLWCSFMLQDRDAQHALSTVLAGERGPIILPILLTQSARSKAEERAIQKAAGINGIGDMATLLQAAPRNVVELLRINTVIRGVSSQLGITMDERKRILARYARKGLPKIGNAGSHVHKVFKRWSTHAKLAVMLGAWQGLTSAQEIGTRFWSACLALFAPIVLD